MTESMMNTFPFDKPILSVEALGVRTSSTDGEKVILKDISFSINRGQVLAITGETGSGKTMTAKAIMGMLPKGLVAKGKVMLGSQSLLDLDPKEMQKIRGRKIGMAFQNPETALNPLLKNRKSLDLTMGKGEEGQVERLSLFGLKDKRILDSFPFELSGGMAQRFMTALSLGQGVDLVIFDEPTRGLDPASRDLLIAMIRILTEDKGLGVLVLTHDMVFIERICKTCLVIQDGKIVESGHAEDVIGKPKSEYMKEVRAADPRLNRILPQSLNSRDRGKPMLEIRKLACSYNTSIFKKDKHKVLEDLNLDIFRGEILGIMGGSGCGKSTLAACILGLINYSGDILYEGESIRGRRRPSLGLISQSATSSFDPARSIGQSLREVFLVHPEYKETDPEVQIKKVLNLVEMGQLYERLDSYPSEFSGGQLQRFAIARTLLSRAQILILDEITSMLDQINQAAIIRLLYRLREEKDLTYLFISHDLPLAKQFCDRMMRMQDGRLEEMI